MKWRERKREGGEEKGRGKRERKRKKEISPPPLGPSSEKEKNRPAAAAAAHSSPKGEKLKLSSFFLPPRVWHRVEEGKSWRERERKVEEVPKIGSNSLLLRMGSRWLLASGKERHKENFVSELQMCKQCPFVSTKSEEFQNENCSRLQRIYV